MEKRNEESQIEARKVFRNQGCRTFFTKDSERKFYFVLTMVMLLLGILYKTGII